MNRKLRLVVMILATVICIVASSVNCFAVNAIATGNWSTAGTWNPAEPVAGDLATIDGGLTVTVNQAGEAVGTLDLGTIAAQTGNLNVDAPGDLTASGGGLPSIRVGQVAGATGNLNVSGGTIAVVGPLPDSGFAIGDLMIGDVGTGTMTMTGGTVTANDEIVIAAGGGSVGTVNISGGSLSTTTDGRSILVGFGGNGTLDVSGTAQVKANFDLLVGFLAGATGNVNQSGGTIEAGFMFSNSFSGAPGSTVNMTMTGGTFNARIAYVMGQGQGTSTMNHSGGAINVTTGNGDMVVSDGNNNTSTYNISGTASVNLSHNFIVGAFNGSNGTVNQSGGTITLADTARIGADGNGAWNLSGGTLNAANVFLGDFDDSNGTMKVSGGTLNLTGNYNVGAALASNAPPDATRSGTQGQAARANGTFIVSGSAGDINIGGDFLANPADKTRPPADANTAMLIFEMSSNAGTSLIDVASAADLDGAVIDLDLLSGYTPAVNQSFVLLTALAGIGGDTGTGTTKINGSTGQAFTLAAEDTASWTLSVISNGGLSESLVANYIPEPSSFALVGFALALAMRTRRKRIGRV